MYKENVNKKIDCNKTSLSNTIQDYFFSYLLNNYNFRFIDQIKYEAAWTFDNFNKVNEFYNNSNNNVNDKQNNLFCCLVGYLVERDKGVIFRINPYTPDLTLSYNDYFTKCFIISHIIKTTHYKVNCLEIDNEVIITITSEL